MASGITKKKSGKDFSSKQKRKSMETFIIKSTVLKAGDRAVYSLMHSENELPFFVKAVCLDWKKFSTCYTMETPNDEKKIVEGYAHMVRVMIKFSRFLRIK